MKNRIVAVLLTLGVLVGAQLARADTCSKNLTGPFPSAQAVKLCSTFSTSIGGSLIPSTDNTYDLGSASKQFRTEYLGTNLVFGAASAKIIPGATSLLIRNNADSSTNLGIVDAGTATFRGNLVLSTAVSKITPGATSFSLRNNADAQDNLIITDAGVATFIGDVVGATSPFNIRTNTADAADSKIVSVNGGGAGSDTTRGGFIEVRGNEASSPGNVSIQNGALSGSTIVIATNNTSGGAVKIRNTSVGDMWNFLSSGPLQNNATGGGDLQLSATGTTISLQEGTGASACMGSVTANAATPVVTSTTCATTASRIFLTKTSTSAVNGSCFISAISNGVSFSITCLATDTGTYNFMIVHESP